jgi:large subunit ribosomal protein L25
MAKVISLKASARKSGKKGAARAARRDGQVPGVIYGGEKEPQPVALDYKQLWKAVETGRFLSTLVDVEIGSDKVRAIPRDIQFDVVRDRVIHVDFLRLGAGQRISVAVPVHFSNHEASPGLKRGGVLNIVRHEIELYCPADNIPEQIEIDLTGWEIGGSIHISHVKLPPNVQPVISDRDFTIATIAGAGGKEEEEPTVETEAVAATPTAEVPATAQKAPAAAAAAAPPAKGGGEKEKKK